MIYTNEIMWNINNFEILKSVDRTAQNPTKIKREWNIFQISHYDVYKRLLRLLVFFDFRFNFVFRFSYETPSNMKERDSLLIKKFIIDASRNVYRNVARSMRFFSLLCR